MIGRRFVVAAAVGLATATVTLATALAAYQSPRLLVTQTGNRVTIDLAQNVGDDPTAVLRLISPLNTRVAELQPPGTEVGTANATFVTSGAGSGTEVTAAGRLVVASLGQIPQADFLACAQGERVLDRWLMSVSGAGITLDVPVYLLAGGDLLTCLPHPSATGGAKLVGLELVIDGPLVLGSVGTWISIWIPFEATGVANPARAVASPAIVSPGSVAFTARPRGAGALITGIVRQGGAPRFAVKVTISGGPRVNALTKLGVATTNNVGRFRFRAAAGTYFRASASVGRASPPGLCFVLEPLLRPILCVNPTLNGFTVPSKTVKKG